MNLHSTGKSVPRVTTFAIGATNQLLCDFDVLAHTTLADTVQPLLSSNSNHGPRSLGSSSSYSTFDCCGGFC